MEGYPINTKQISRLLGFSIPDDFVLDLEREEILPFKQRIQEESVKPFPIESMKSLLRELSDKKKRTMAAHMKWPIRFHPKKRFPDVVFIKYLGTELQQKEGKQKLLVAILFAILDLYDEEEESAGAFLAAQNEKIKEHGYWHYYWALRFYPDHTEEVKKRLLELAAGDGQSNDHRFAEPPNPAVVDNTKHGRVMEKYIAALKRKLDRESDLRQKADKVMNRLRNELRRQDKLAEHLSAEKSRLEEDLASAVDRVSRMQTALDEQRKRNETLLNEKIRMQSQVRTMDNELAGLRAKADAAERDLKQSKLCLDIERNKSSNPMELAGKLLSCLYTESEQLCQKLSYHKENGSELRRKIRTLFDMIDQLEQYRQEDLEMFPTVKLQTAAELPKPADEEPVTWFNGTFYRRDHGGYIVLEHGEAFNITESMVHHHSLQHEAEVLCKPNKQENGAILYEIELLLQGDDAFSSVRRFDGYIMLGEHFTWYCVDINNSENRYPLHYKDVEMQQPADGDACLFNVAEGGRIARLSRLYREKPKEAVVNEKTNAIKSSLIMEGKQKRKPEPYLTGCRIVIVGGQQKWFESVITETGAELIHEKGDNPERIHADLRRANALFMLLTATSHRATWSCVEIAKQNRIPHFVIQGSKSNLRTLLWENREVILRKQ